MRVPLRSRKKRLFPHDRELTASEATTRLLQDALEAQRILERQRALGRERFRRWYQRRKAKRAADLTSGKDQRPEARFEIVGLESVPISEQQQPKRPGVARRTLGAAKVCG